MAEANLLIETAVSNRKIRHIEKSLADQLVHRDALQLRYSRLQQEKARSKLTTAELHVGRVRMIVRRSGYSPDVRQFYTTAATLRGF